VEESGKKEDGQAATNNTNGSISTSTSSGDDSCFFSLISRFGGWVLLAFSIVGLIVGFAMMGVTVFTPWRLMNNFNSGVVGMWGGFGSAWVIMPISVWWLAPYFREHHTPHGHYFALALESVFLLFGILGFCGWVATEGEVGDAFAILILWVLPAILAILMSVGFFKLAPSAAPSAPTCKGCSCCNGRVCLVTLGAFLVVVGLFFACGAGINGVLSAAGNAAYPMPGELFTVSLAPEVPDAEVRMHLYCTGPTDSARPTIVLVHGGGANSLTMVGLQRELVNEHGFRACVYDRLGYGYTPSYYVRGNLDDKPFPTDGELLLRLLAAAGEAGPFSCAGHSAGATVCTRFAMDGGNDVVGVVGIDGYPDVIRPAQFRPGFYEPSNVVGTLLVSAVLSAAQGITRGLVGATSDSAAPDLEAASEHLYAQERFWVSQLWDVVADVNSGDSDSAYLYRNIPGAYQDQTTGHVYYGSSLNVSVGWVVAWNTVNSTCTADYQYNADCCKEDLPYWCPDQIEDKQFYWQQAQLYVETLGVAPGRLFQGPEPTEHNFVNNANYMGYVAQAVSDSVP
jgi:pimeloyl-ACP methyl ester carboxylesterase